MRILNYLSGFCCFNILCYKYRGFDESFVKVIYPIDTFVSVIKIPDSALFQNQYIFIENNGFSKKIKVNLLFKGQDYFLIDDLMLNQKNVIINRFSSDIEGKKIKIF